MKITNFVCILIFGLSVNLSYSQANTISLDLQNVTVGQILDEIESATNFRFIYKIKDVKIDRIVSVDVYNQDVGKLLTVIFTGTNTSFKIIEKQIFLVNNKTDKAQIEKSEYSNLTISTDSINVVTGIVLDVDGLPLPGVKVVNLARNIISKTESETDFDGNFSVNGFPGELLQFSFMGMEVQEVAIQENTSINIMLVPDESALEEVILTALGVEKSKRSLAFAVTEVEAKKLYRARVPNIGNALVGKVAGVQVTAPATGVGGSSRVIIRGNSSLTGYNQPLYVLDGIPINNKNYGSAGQWGGSDKGDGISNINTDDIETMTVLKGANASALYGSRGVNGVILITTKSGKTSEGIRIELNSNFQLDQTVSDQEHQLVYGQGIEGRVYTSQQELLGTTDGGLQSWGAKLDGSQVVQFDGVMRPYSYTGNAQDQFYQNGFTFSNTLSLLGGDEKTNWRFSLADVQNESVVPNSKFSRNNYSVKINTQLSKRFSANIGGVYIRQHIKNAIRVSDFTHNVNTGIANVPANVNIGAMAGSTEKKGADLDGRELNTHGTIWWGNPYWAAYQDERNDEKERILGTVSLKYDIADWLYVKGRIGIDSQTLEQEERTAYGDLIDSGIGSISHITNRFYEQNLEGFVGANRELNDAFSLSLLLGGSKMLQENNSKSVQGNTFDIPFWEVYENTKNRSSGKGFNSQQTNSLFYSAEVSYKRIVYLTTTGRSDWFSTLNGRSQFYPSMGVSAILSEIVTLPESFDFFKVSSSVGKSSGSTEPYQLNSSYGLGVPFNGESVGGVAQSTIPNTSLIPFLTSEFEVGLEFKMFSSQLGLDITYYNKKTSDDILNAVVSKTSGYDSKVLNIGQISNQGIELLVYGNPIKTSYFDWGISFNLGYNKNEVISLLNPNIDNEGMLADRSRHLHAFIYHFEGLPYSQVSGYKYLRDVSGDLILTAEGLPQRDETIGINGIVPFGTGNAPIYGGLSNELRFKDLSLSFLIDYRFGGVMHSGSNARAYQYGLHEDTLEGREQGIGIIPAENIKSYYKAIADNITEQFIYKSDFVKLREIVISYPLPEAVLDKVKIEGLEVSLVGRNLWTIYKDVPNVDPESSYNVENGQGLEFFPVPRIRSVGLNLNIKI